MSNRVIVLGYSKSGKTTAAELLARLSGSPPSANCSDFIISDFAVENHLDPKKILANKDKYRQDLFKYGLGRQAKDPAYPVSEAFKYTNIVTGVRTKENLEAAKKLGDPTVVWIDRQEAKPNTTDKLGPEDADKVIDNNGDFDDLEMNLMSLLLGSKT